MKIEQVGSKKKVTYRTQCTCSRWFSTPTPENLANLSWLRDKVASLLDSASENGLLTDQDYFVLSMRFRLADRSPKTFEEVRAAMGRTRARAGQLLNEAVGKLRASVPGVFGNSAITFEWRKVSRTPMPTCRFIEQERLCSYSSDGVRQLLLFLRCTSEQ